MIESAEKGDALRRVLVFLGLTVALSSVFYALIIGAGTLAVQSELYVLALMWCPGAAGLITTAVFQRNLRGLGWRPGHPRYLLAAYALPLLYGGCAYALIWLSGLGAFSAERVPPGASLLGFVAQSAVVGVLISLISATGEEIGWRGVLVPQLARLASFRATALISGAVWALWHVPLLLFADYNGGTPAWFGLPCFAVLVVSMSFVFAWLRLASGSLWPAALLHASHNLFIQGLFDVLTRDTGRTAYVSGEFGLGLALAALALSSVFWRARPPAAHAPPSRPSGPRLISDQEPARIGAVQE